MKRAIAEHVSGFITILAITFLALSLIQSHQDAARADALRLITPYLTNSVDLTDPLDAALFKEALRVFYPEGPRPDSISAAVDFFILKKMTDATYKSGREPSGLTFESLGTLAWMYLRFVAVFTLVAVLTFLGARTLAIHEFIQMKVGNDSSLRRLVMLYDSFRSGNAPPAALKKGTLLVFRALLKGLFSLFLFSPAYVLAYALKTEVETGNLMFMAVLAVVSNGVLISMTGTFYAFLVQEGRKGYVETALVKELDSSYIPPVQFERRMFALARPMHAFSHHVFKHIYMNASFQYISALKQHVAFLITGLIIIEMALNIQGHLCYELLKSLLFEDYEVAAAIIIGIFFAVKLAELFIDLWYEREFRKYHNAV